MIYKRFLKPLFFTLDPERVHEVVTSLLRLCLSVPGAKSLFSKTFGYHHKKLERDLFGLHFKNPIGMAAGFDKNAEYVDELAALGFGFVEIGTVTPLAQSGNEKPRMFRLPEDEALINRMGFNNDGAKAVASCLRKKKSDVIIGGNIGKNKSTPNKNAIADYEICFRELFDVVDYFVVNVSSPNTPGLRELQEKEPLKKLLNHLQSVNKELSANHNRPKPILLKIAPDLTDSQLDDIIAIIFETKLDGVVATNTTVSREGLVTDKNKIQQAGAGGISGKPLTKRSTEVIRYIREHSGSKIKIIGVGGIHSPEDAIKKLAAGADLIQLYTGFIYEGPHLVSRINKAIITGA